MTDLLQLEELLAMMTNLTNDETFFASVEDRVVINDVELYKCAFSSGSGCCFSFKSKKYLVSGMKSINRANITIMKNDQKNFGIKEEKIYKKYRFETKVNDRRYAKIEDRDEIN